MAVNHTPEKLARQDAPHASIDDPDFESAPAHFGVE